MLLKLVGESELPSGAFSPFVPSIGSIYMPPRVLVKRNDFANTPCSENLECLKRKKGILAFIWPKKLLQRHGTKKSRRKVTQPKKTKY